MYYSAVLDAQRELRLVPLLPMPTGANVGWIGTGRRFPTLSLTMRRPFRRLFHRIFAAAGGLIENASLVAIAPHAELIVNESGMADRIPSVDAAFDAVVVSGVLCSVSDVSKALAEVGRMLRHGGELRFYQHVRIDKSWRGRFQDVVNLVWPRFMGGCHPNRRSLAAIEGAGDRVARCRSFTFPPTVRISPVAPRNLGVARLER